MTHFIQLPNKSVELLDQELALKNGSMTFEFGGVEKVLVTETELQNAIAGMSAPITVANLAERDALTDLEMHKRVFVQDDGDGKWAYYLTTNPEGTTAAERFTKVSDEDIFGALFSDNVTAQVSKIGELSNLNSGIAAATIIEAINNVYTKHNELNTKVGELTSLTTTEKGSIVGSINDLQVQITSNDGDILTIQNNIGDIATINLTESTDKASIVAALNKIISVQETKLDAQDMVPIIIGYTGLLTELSTTNQNSLVEAINEIVGTVASNNTAIVTVTGDLANLVTTDKTNLVAAINEVQGNVVSETAARTAADNTLQTNIDNENTRAKNAEAGLQTAIDNETLRAKNAEAGLQTELDNTQLGAGLEVNGGYVADSSTNYLTGAVSLKDADKKLDAQSKVNADAIATETTRATAAEAGLQSNIDSEVARATAAETALQNSITNLESAVGGDTGDLANLTTDAKTDLVAAINEVDAHSDANAAAIAAETTRATTAEAGLQSNIDALGAANTATTDDLQAQITAEVARATAAESTLDNKIDTAVANLVDGAPELLDTLNELAAAIGDDENFSATVAENIAAAKAENKALIDANTAVVNSNTAAIAAEVARATAAETANATAIADETTARTVADNALDSRITTLEGNVGGAMGDLSTLTTDVKSTIVGAINEVDAHSDANTAAITQEVTDRTAAVTAEETARIAGDQAQATALAAEVTRATAAEAANAAAISNEVTRATTAEGNLGFNAALSATNLTEAINEVYSLSTSGASNVQAALDAEIARATAAENTNATAITNETTRATTAEAGLQTAIDNETARATAAESANVTAISNEATTRATNDGSLTFNSGITATNLTDAINAENTRAKNAEAGLQTAIDNETLRATAAETANATAISNETARATAAEAANAAAITALENATNNTTGDLSNLSTDATTVVGAINEVDAHSDINTNQISSIKAFLNDVIAKSGKTVNSVSLVANTQYTIDISDLASTNITVSVYSIDGTVLSQEYGLFVAVDTTNKSLKITSAIDVTVRVVITSDISGLTIS